MKQITLTKSEKEIMGLLWNIDRPLTATEIVNLTPERTWKKSYIHLLINSLLEKQLIRSESLVRTGRNFGRAFVATMTEEQFSILQITTGKNFSQKSIPFLISSLIDMTDDVKLIEEIEKTLCEKKEAMKTKALQEETDSVS